MTAYFISGLAADKLAFCNIHLADSIKTVYLDWIDPYENETLATYAARLAKQIDTSEPFSLIGLSMGGMVAAEIAHILNPKKVVIISSISTASELPFYYRWASKIGVHKLLSLQCAQAFFVKMAMLKHNNQSFKKMALHYLRHINPNLLKWSLKAILTWDSQKPVKNLLHIHGAKDRLLPLCYVQKPHAILQGGHLIVFTHGKEISNIVNHYLLQNSSTSL